MSILFGLGAVFCLSLLSAEKKTDETQKRQKAGVAGPTNAIASFSQAYDGTVNTWLFFLVQNYFFRR
jgi:hypothetical protein